MARTRRPRRRRGVLRHYDRPLWRDRMFWVVAVPSVLVTAALIGLVLVVGGVPDDPVGWVRPALVGVVVLLVAFRMLGAGVTTTRHFQRGLGEGTARRESAMEAKGRVAGRAVGSALRSARTPRAASRGPAATAAAVPASPAAPEARPDPQPRRPTTGVESAPVPGPGSTAAPAPSAPTPRPPDPTDPTEPTEPAVTPTPAPAVDHEPPAAGPDAAAPAPAAPAAPAAPTPKVTADAAARVAGAMVGRRLAERRRRRDQPPT